MNSGSRRRNARTGPPRADKPTGDRTSLLHPSSFILHPSSFILHPLFMLAVVLVPVVGPAADVPAPAPRVQGTPGQHRRLTLADASGIRPTEAKELKLNDLVVVVVDEKSQVISEGEMDRRKKADSTFALKDWILIHGLTAEPDPQSDGEPTISGELQSKY